jgi:Mg2+ and Co2+ transporter CorA
MAIDMIEHNELGALSHSRLGSANFINEVHGDSSYANLFGSRNRKKSKFREDVRNLYKDMKTDCDSLLTNIDTISADLETLVKRSASKSTLERKEKLDETQIILGEMKSLQAKQQCTTKSIQAEREKTATDNIKTLTQLSDITVDKAKADLGQTTDPTKSNSVLYWYIGGGFVVVAIITLIVLKKKK